MKYKKCSSCQYQDRPQYSYPCSRCEEFKQYPITCKECRIFYIIGGCKKGIFPCRDFEWS